MEDFLPRIGIFDSGIGGFSILFPCLDEIPAVYYYWGDNARAPYGSRPGREIMAFTREAFCEFARLKVDAAVIACNTATAVCAEALRAEFSFPVLGMEPAVKPAAAHCRRALVLATPRTAASPRFKKLLSRYPQEQFEVFAPPRLAQAVEDHFLRGEALTLSEHLPPIEGFDGAVLGCTHYSLIKREIFHFWGTDLFDGTDGTVRHLKNVLGIGICDHLKPQAPKIDYLTKNLTKMGNSRVFFLGSGHNANKSFFNSNIRFRKT